MHCVDYVTILVFVCVFLSWINVVICMMVLYRIRLRPLKKPHPLMGPHPLKKNHPLRKNQRS